MTVYFNNKPIPTQATTLLDVLEENKLLHKMGMAVAINNAVIPKTHWNQTALKQHDNILIITATQGG
jgi:sulfur carrier protein